ncbi:MAG TPA: fused response regulator/phosphatase [Solirubrobacteraceae bacterium]|nr:fused response regulator/phosphatase [Solirubrobacteraceae bacterium]
MAYVDEGAQEGGVARAGDTADEGDPAAVAGAPAEGAKPPITDQPAIELLLVEDDDGDAVLVEDQLAEDLPRAHVTRSRNLAEAIAGLDSPLDCVLLDLRLPDAAGMDAVGRVRSQAPSVPLIVLTGLDNEAAGVAAVAAGAQDYLVKGKVGGGVLGRSIRYAIGRHQTEEAERQLLLVQARAQELARLERGLAPRPLIQRDSAWVASRYRAGRGSALLGGDFYDAVQVPDGSLRLVVGDVCGHGADEAAIGVSLRSSWRALALAGTQPAAIMGTLERVFEHERHVPSLFATLCMLEIDTRAGVATVVQAGHPPPLQITGGAVAPLLPASGEHPIGLGDGRWSERSVALAADWAILLYTDGIIEGRIGDGPERLGEEGLLGLVDRHIAERADWRGRPGALLDELISHAERLNGRPLIDDIAMLLVGAPYSAGPVPA